MMAPLPFTDPRAAEPADEVGVRFAVRVGTGRVIQYPFDKSEFLVGGADGCDLRLPGSNHPPVVCQFIRSGTSVQVCRRAPSVTAALNGVPLASSDPVPLSDGDRVTIGPTEVVVYLPPTEYVVPRLVPVGETSEAEGAALDRREAELSEYESTLIRFQGELTELRDSLSRQYKEQQSEAARQPPPAADLSRLRAELEAEHRSRLEALEADYSRRRRELEIEHDRRMTADESVFADRLRQIEEEVARRRLQFEMEVREYEPRFTELRLRRQQADEAIEQLARERQGLESLRADVEREKAAAAAPYVGREEEITRREEHLRAERERYAADLARLDRWQGTLDARQDALDRRAAEIDGRFEQLRTDAAEREELVRLADSEQDRIRGESDRLDRLKSELADREAKLAERVARVEAQQATLAVLRAKFDRQQEDARRESAQLAADHARAEAARKELDERLLEAEQLRAHLGSVRADHESQRQAVAEQQSLLAASLEDIRQQKEALSQEAARLARKEQELDARSADVAEQTAVLKARVTQVSELRERLEADRHAVRDRESTVASAEAARQVLQEQLRRRADELASRSAHLEELSRTLAGERTAVDQFRADLAEQTRVAEEKFAELRRDLADRAAGVERQSASIADREAAIARQVERLKEVGRAVAAERKTLADERKTFAAVRENADAFRAKIAEQMDELRRQAPQLEAGAREALEKLAAARDVLRGHLAELHEYARLAREELDAARGRARADADVVRERAEELEKARAEHRLAVAGFRQQLLEWQARITELKQTMAKSESRLEQRRAEVDAAARQVDATTQELSRQEAELRQERAIVAEKRSEMERHLADMRAWYKKKLRELAAGRPVDESDMPVLAVTSPAPRADTGGDSGQEPASIADLDPGDRHLGELLQSRGLVDADTVHALWAEAQRQRRTLRQVLLASGVVTLYQLALIEAGNLDALMLGRLRVVDRVRATQRETVYRVFDPNRRTVCLLRHLAESEMQDAVRPDEFRQRFAAAAAASHPNLANSLELLEIGGRPAVLQEWIVGLPSPDWPAAAATPGVWLKLLAEAARGIAHVHRNGLVHGRLGADSFLITPGGELKILGVGEPPWLTESGAAFDPLPAADLRALGLAAFGWTQLAAKKRGPRAKPFPPGLAAVIRRLESGAEPPMADVVAFDRPYADAAELIRDLELLAGEHPLTADAWAKLTAAVAETLQGSVEMRQSA